MITDAGADSVYNLHERDIDRYCEHVRKYSRNERTHCSEQHPCHIHFMDKFHDLRCIDICFGRRSNANLSCMEQRCQLLKSMCGFKKKPRTLKDLCIQRVFSYGGYCCYADIIDEKWYNENKNLFLHDTTYDGQLWHLRGTTLNFFFRRYQSIYYNLLRNMEYLKEALVDIAQSLFGTPWILLKIWIESYAMILIDTVEEETLNNLVRFREHFLEAMRDKSMDDVEQTDGERGTKYLEEGVLNDQMLKDLWRTCLGVDSGVDSSTMLFPFPVMRKMLSFLRNYKDDHIMEDCSSNEGLLNQLLLEEQFLMTMYLTNTMMVARKGSS